MSALYSINTFDDPNGPPGYIRLLLWDRSMLSIENPKTTGTVQESPIVAGEIRPPAGDYLQLDDWDNRPYADLTGDMYEVSAKTGLDLQANTVGGLEPGHLRAVLLNKEMGSGHRYDSSNLGSDLTPGYLERGNMVTLVMHYGGPGTANQRMRILWMGWLEDLTPVVRAQSAPRVRLTARGMLGLISYEDTFIPGVSENDFPLTPDGSVRRVTAEDIIGRLDLFGDMDRDVLTLNFSDADYAAANKRVRFLGRQRSWRFWPGSLTGSPYYTLARIAHNDLAYVFESRFQPLIIYQSRALNLPRAAIFISDGDGTFGDVASVWDPTLIEEAIPLGERFNEYQATVGTYWIDNYTTKPDTYFDVPAEHRAALDKSSTLNEDAAGLALPAQGISQQFDAQTIPVDARFEHPRFAGDSYAYRRRFAHVGATKYELSEDGITARTTEEPPRYVSSGLSIVQLEWCVEGVRFKVRNQRAAVVVLEIVHFDALAVGFESIGVHRVKDSADIAVSGLRRYNFTPIFESEDRANDWIESVKSRYGDDTGYISVSGFINLNHKGDLYTLLNAAPGYVAEVRGEDSKFYRIVSTELRYRYNSRKVDMRLGLLSDGVHVRDESGELDLGFVLGSSELGGMDTLALVSGVDQYTTLEVI